MRFPNLFSFVALSSYVVASTEVNMTSPFGLTFSPTTIYASRFKASGSIEVTRYPATPDYQRYYHNVVQKYGSLPKIHESLPNIDESLSDVLSVFQHTIAPLIEGLTKQLGHAPNFSSLFLSSLFGYDTVHVVDYIMFFDPEWEHLTRSGSAREAACYGFGFLQGRNLGRPIEECNDDGPESYVLVLEYEKEYLYAFFMEVAFELGTYPVHEKKLCKACGEAFRQDTGYHDRVNVFLDNFINKQVLQKYHKREDIRAIVIYGESSPLSNTELGAVALEVVGTSDVKLMTGIEPSEVVAHGAAVWAQYIQQHPDDSFSYPPRNVVLEGRQYIGENIPMYNKLIEAGRGVEGHDEL